MLLSKRLLKGVNITAYKPDVFKEEGVLNSNNEDINNVEKKDLERVNEDYQEVIFLKEDLEKRINEISLFEKEAYERGYSTGEKAGFEMGIKKAEVIIEKFQSLLEELENLKENYIRENDKKILALSIAIARKILEREIKEDEKVLINILHNALKRIERREKLTITINPAMQSIIEKFKGDIKEICHKIIIDIDPNVSKNFVKLESETEEIIIDFEQELYDISRKLSELI
ncbi:MAG: FliH/SctL family protein [Proteobacteria bacterium]|nr:FliH/SctL family protein [Pseudomonadota bacterium]